MGWIAPLRHQCAKLVFSENHQEQEPSMSEITTIGLDLAKQPRNHGMRRVLFGLYACRPNDISPLCNVRVPLKTDSRSRWG